MAKLLVVDDDPEVQELLSVVFKKDYEVLQAYDTREAKELVEDNFPEVAIVDMQLKEETGESLIHTAGCEDCSFILLTGNSTGPQFKADMLSMGFLYVVEKPFSPVELQAVVKRALNHHYAKKQSRKLRSNTEIRYNPDSFRRLQEAALAFKVAVGQ